MGRRSRMSATRQSKRRAMYVAIIVVVVVVAVLAIGAVLVLSLSSTNAPKLAASGVKCYLLAEIHPTLSCQMLLSNTGSQSIGIQGCSVQLGGVTYTGFVQSAATAPDFNLTSIKSNTTSLKVYCFAPVPGSITSGGPSGSIASGSIETNNTTISFSGTWA